MKYLFILILFVQNLAVFAQGSDEQLAAQYYSNGEYDKAIVLYKKIFKDNPNSLYVYENYLNSLIAVGDQSDAEDLVKKQIKRVKTGFNYKVDLGYVYDQFKEPIKAKDYFNELMDEYLVEQNAVNSLAQAFLRRQYLAQAIQCFELGVERCNKKKNGVYK